MSQQLQLGDIVTGIYKTGKYIGEISDIKPERYVMRVLAVLKHPKQGDLHQAKSVDVPLFHQRRALAYREQTNVPKVYVKEYIGEIPDYKLSLKIALDEEKALLEHEDSQWAQKALEMLNDLEKDYFKE